MLIQKLTFVAFHIPRKTRNGESWLILSILRFKVGVATFGGEGVRLA